MRGFLNSQAGCHSAAVQSILSHARTPWWKFLARRRHLQAAYDWSLRATRQPMNSVIRDFNMPPTAINPSDSECAGPR